MSRMPFTDTHVHFFDMREPELAYDFLGPGGDPDRTAFVGDYSAMRAERYWADDFIAETRFHNVERVVHMQAALGIADPVAETTWLQRFHDRLGVPHAIVAYVDLAAADARETLAQHCVASPIVRGCARPSLRRLPHQSGLGGRVRVAWRSRTRLLRRPLLEHVPAAAALAARQPEVPLCVDHALMPRQRDDEYFREWREAIRLLAAVPSTVVKISGLGMGDHTWTVDSLRPWVLSCIEAFGVNRAFFGTNWPVDRLYSSYGDVLDAYAEIASGFFETEQRALMSGNAKRVFGLE